MNITPDSFSDGGKLFSEAPDLDAVRRCGLQMVADGAAYLDIGGESTRPGAEPVGEQEELDRVIPCVEALAAEVDAVISVDTSTPAVMREAAHAGAGLINDVGAWDQSVTVAGGYSYVAAFAATPTVASVSPGQGL